MFDGPFDDVFQGHRITINGPQRFTTQPLEAPYDVTTKEFEGGRASLHDTEDQPPALDEDNAITRFVMELSADHS